MGFINFIPALVALVLGLLITAALALVHVGSQWLIALAGSVLSLAVAAYIAYLLSGRVRLKQLLQQADLQLRAARDKVEALSRTDDLTQIANRRFFDEYLEIEWNRARREHRVLSVILMDVDFFKHFNDCYGLDAGDECLRQVALSLRSCFTRSGDLIARYSAEEFAAVLPGTELTDNQFIDRCCEVVSGQKIPHRGSDISEVVTISAGGCSLLPSESLKVEDLIKTAQQALHRAKAEGRNRAISFDFARGPGKGGVNVQD